MSIHHTDLTPHRLYLMAESYQTAGSRIVADPDFEDSVTDGPARLVFYQALELYLRCFLLLQGMQPAQLLALSTDLEALVDCATAAGMPISPTTAKFVRSVGRNKDYAKVRYDLEGQASMDALKLLVRAVIEVRLQVRTQLMAEGVDPGP